MAEVTAQKVKELREKSGAGMMDCKKALAEANGEFDQALTLLRERGAAIASKRGARTAKEGLVAVYISPDSKSAGIIELNCETDFVARNEVFQQLAADLAEHASKSEDTANINDTSFRDSTAGEVVKALIGTIGENMVLNRAGRLVAGSNGRPAGLIFSYIHPPGRVGVLVEIATDKNDLASNPEFVSFARDIAMHIAASSPLGLTRDEVPADVIEKEKSIYRNKALNEGKPENIVERIVEGALKKFYQDNLLLEQAFVKDDKIKVEDYVKQGSKQFGTELAVTAFISFRLGETVASESSEENA
jgi:elongation factor Ts